VFVASSLRNVAARLFPWFSRSSTAIETSTATPIPSPHPTPPPGPRRTQRLVDRMEAGIGVVPVAKTQIVARPKRRPFQPHPTLWWARNNDTERTVYCGPIAVAAAIGADVDEVIALIQRNRNDCRPVVGTSAGELRRVFQHYGYDLQLVDDLSSNSPTLARWERARSDREFDQALLVTVTGHWVAVRGRWFADTGTDGRPVRLSDAPGRRKRVRFVYSVVPLPQWV
jgi:hypothetical protein